MQLWTAMKIILKRITIVVKGASELHNLLSSHHRANGEGVLIPMDDVSKRESREGHLG